MRLRRFAHWATLTAIALLAAKAVPFTGLYATATAAIIAAAVGLVGIALTPQEDHR